MNKCTHELSETTTRHKMVDNASERRLISRRLSFDALALREVPHGYEARVSSTTSAREEEFAVTAELEIAQRALRKREHAEKFQIA